MNALQRLWYSVKALTVRFVNAPHWGSLWLGSTRYDYEQSVGEPRTNAAVFACVRWAQRTLPEAPLILHERQRDGTLDPKPDHALSMLLERPNPFYSGLHLIGAVVADLMLTGNAYVVKVRSGATRVVQLWWIPSTMLEPKWPEDGATFISHYEYSVNNEQYRVEVRDVVHFRQGFDPNNMRKGLSDLQALFRELATDNEAANWTASLLRNQAVPGVIVSPADKDARPTKEEAEANKANFIAKFGGDRRGEPLMMGSPTKVDVLSFNPEQMNLRDIRIVPEERITAVFGIPAIVVGLGAGLQRSTFANFAEAREAAYESFVIPLQRLLAAELQSQLVPDFGDQGRLRISFDLSAVRVLQQDENALHTRVREDLKAGLITLAQAQQEIGQEPDPNGEIYYVPTGITVTPAAEIAEKPEPLALGPGNQQDDDESDDEDTEDEESEPKGRKADRVQPRGAGDPFDALPLSVEYTTHERRAISQTWDATMGNGLTGLLEAETDV